MKNKKYIYECNRWGKFFYKNNFQRKSSETVLLLNSVRFFFNLKLCHVACQLFGCFCLFDNRSLDPPAQWALLDPGQEFGRYDPDVRFSVRFANSFVSHWEDKWVFFSKASEVWRLFCHLWKFTQVKRLIWSGARELFFVLFISEIN